MTKEILELLLGLSSLGAVGAGITYWGGRISRSVEIIAEQITALREDMQSHSTRLDKHADKLDDHGQRLSVVETRQGG